ncbi:MAG: 50S ribosomal protein L18 [Candidatus Dojkabacteria bacterium]|nr:MAG: 50S ribosomal protein L18 [Candidatus Dojkabacteria bacterium]
MKPEIKIKNRIRRHLRVRKKISGSSKRPRVLVFKSNKYNYVQAIDDEGMRVITSMSDKDLKGTKTERAFELGKAFGKLLKNKKYNSVVFDRGGFKYHGRVKAIADGLREAGIKV